MGKVAKVISYSFSYISRLYQRLIVYYVDSVNISKRRKTNTLFHKAYTLLLPLALQHYFHIFSSVQIFYIFGWHMALLRVRLWSMVLWETKTAKHQSQASCTITLSSNPLRLPALYLQIFFWNDNNILLCRYIFCHHKWIANWLMWSWRLCTS